MQLFTASWLVLSLEEIPCYRSTYYALINRVLARLKRSIRENNPNPVARMVKDHPMGRQTIGRAVPVSQEKMPFVWSLFLDSSLTATFLSPFSSPCLLTL